MVLVFRALHTTSIERKFFPPICTGFSYTRTVNAVLQLRFTQNRNQEMK
jgi:hypothetical protein